MRPHLVFGSSGITRLVLRIIPIGIFPRTPSFTNLSFVDAPHPLTGHSYLLHTPQDFVGTRRLAFARNVQLPSTLPSDCLSSSVCNLIRRCPIHLPPLAQGARRSPLIYPANRIWSEDGHHAYGVTRYVPLIVVFGLRMQLPRRPVMTRHPNAGAGGLYYLFPSKFICVKVG